MTDTVEAALTFPCGDAKLVGILHLPTAPNRRGVVVVVGAPQYRAGSHRQFVLLARDLAEAGYAVLRFDYRGMGDSAGDFSGFEAVETDIRAAVDTLCDRVPDVGEVVLWGLCDGAAAIAFYAAGDPRVTGVVLVNPWVRVPASFAQAQVHHYYLRRLALPSFWRRLIGLEVDFGTSLRSFVGTLVAAVLGRLRGTWSGRAPGRPAVRTPARGGAAGKGRPDVAAVSRPGSRGAERERPHRSGIRGFGAEREVDAAVAAAVPGYGAGAARSQSHLFDAGVAATGPRLDPRLARASVTPAHRPSAVQS